MRVTDTYGSFLSVVCYVVTTSLNEEGLPRQRDELKGENSSPQ
jgi:hypothetical protein